jgi:hypothetical protein
VSHPFVCITEFLIFLRISISSTLLRVGQGKKGKKKERKKDILKIKRDDEGRTRRGQDKTGLFRF